jgi:hypothetical protein
MERESAGGGMELKGDAMHSAAVLAHGLHKLRAVLDALMKARRALGRVGVGGHDVRAENIKTARGELLPA